MTRYRFQHNSTNLVSANHFSSNSALVLTYSTWSFLCCSIKFTFSNVVILAKIEVLMNELSDSFLPANCDQC